VKTKGAAAAPVVLFGRHKTKWPTQPTTGSPTLGCLGLEGALPLPLFFLVPAMMVEVYCVTMEGCEHQKSATTAVK
jgi:hypothetical protein